MASRLQCIPVVRALAVTCVLAFAPGVAHADPFEPPSSVAAAQDHYTRGKALFAAKQYADAAAEFQSALELDASAKFLLFDLALARRMAGACRDAVTAYQTFLDAHPPEKYAASARIGIDKCKDMLVHAPPPEKPAAPPPAAPPPTVAAPPPTVIVPPPARTLARSPWYRDRIGDALAGTGVAVVLTGGVFLVLAHHAADDTYSASSLASYHQSFGDAQSFQGLAVILAGAGTALIATGIVRYALRPEHDVVVAPAPTRGGASLAVEGVF
jgi:tetratricopeptide (TPR) repeat protein